MIFPKTKKQVQLVKLEPYHMDDDSARQKLLATMYDSARHNRFLETINNQRMARLDAKKYHLSFNYDASLKKFRCHGKYKSNYTFVFGTVPPKSRNKFFNTDTVYAIHKFHNGIEHIKKLLIAKENDRYETYLYLEYYV